MKDATNLIMNTLARKGYYPKISISNDEGIRINISIEIADHPIFFSYDYDDRALTYALKFSYEGELAMDKHLEILRIFDSDESKCFDSFQDDYYNGYLSLMGRRWDFDITVEFIEQIIDEISRLNVIKKLNEISHNEV